MCTYNISSLRLVLLVYCLLIVIAIRCCILYSITFYYILLLNYNIC